MHTSDGRTERGRYVLGVQKEDGRADVELTSPYLIIPCAFVFRKRELTFAPQVSPYLARVHSIKMQFFFFFLCIARSVHRYVSSMMQVRL